MNFAVTGEHRDFFRKHGWIEVEDLLSISLQKEIKEAILSTLSKRLKSLIPQTTDFPVDSAFEAGYDVWRDNAILKKTFLNKKLAEIAAELIELRPLRFGYDQFLAAPTSLVFNAQGSYGQLLEKTYTLQEMSAIQGVVCGLMFCLAAPQSGEGEHSIFSTHPGNGVFFAPTHPIHFSELLKRPGGMYHLLVYTKSNAVYRLEMNDPHAHDFKRLGYNFGDRLSDVHNPLVF